ncbi:hypothetical protein [Limnochorda pilosa]|uniref:Lysine transporter LysE n=1 Tax=Limnochorda pilosa TaxID=1555112 RepID=A0A0K2SKM0_LIMPI|nr:hypothetical protein [Limnochorda pilosa]BAS27572.1 hypothetical protein LIP_1726 [Limnochorda pilosa]
MTGARVGAGALGNPLTILGFAALSARAKAPALSLGLPLGVFTGSTVWGLVVSGAAGVTGRALSPRALRVTGVVSGGILLALAVWTLTLT